MAADNLKQLGRRLGKTRDDIQYVSTDVSKNFNIIEESSDIISSLNTYKFEFKTYTKAPFVTLDITVFKKFKSVKNG